MDHIIPPVTLHHISLGSPSPSYEFLYVHFTPVLPHMIQGCVLLRTSYRAHPNIVKLYSSLFYENATTSVCEDEHSLLRFSQLQQFQTFCSWSGLTAPQQIGHGFPFLVHHVDGLEARDYDSPSWYNADELEVVWAHIESLFREFPMLTEEQIGVIAPYHKQVGLVCARLDAASARVLHQGGHSRELPGAGKRGDSALHRAVEVRRRTEAGSANGARLRRLAVAAQRRAVARAEAVGRGRELQAAFARPELEFVVAFGGALRERLGLRAGRSGAARAGANR